RHDVPEDRHALDPRPGLGHVPERGDDHEEEPQDEERPGDLEPEVLVEVREEAPEPLPVPLHVAREEPGVKKLYSPSAVRPRDPDMPPLRTPLFAWHAAAGARPIEFGGWEMPLQYTGIVEEHLAVRRAAGLFDVSHMGKLLLEGPGTAEAVNRLSTNDIPASPGRCRYTHLLDEGGRILDDVIFTCLGPDRYLCVCNAGPRPRVVEWIRAHLRGPAFRDLTTDHLCLALQGPRAAEVLGRLTAHDLTSLKPFRAAHVDLRMPGGAPPETVGRGSPPTGLSEPGTTLITRTGYTGEDGLELFPPSAAAVPVWTGLVDAGADLGLRPVG